MGRHSLLLLFAVLCGCVGPVEPVRNFASDQAGCEPPTDANLVPEARMLPGRVCQDCHKQGGTGEPFVWTASGTVYPSPTALCDTGGVDGVTVDILDGMSGNVLISLTTNRSGNFYTSESLNSSTIRARISKGSAVQEMVIPSPSTACATCHQPGGEAGGRIYLPN